jgi:hypothetical protein
VAQFYDFAPFDIVSSFTLLFTFVPKLRQHARYHAMALQKLQGMHNCALGFLGNASVAERAPSLSSNLKMDVDVIKAKTKLSEPTKEII